MKPHPLLIATAGLIAAASLALGGRELAILFGRETSALDLAAPILSVATALICITMLDWARNLPRRSSRADEEELEDDENLEARMAEVRAAALDKKLVETAHAIEALAGGEGSTDKIVEEATKLVGDFARGSSVALWLADDAGGFRLRGELVDGVASVSQGSSPDAAEAEELQQLVECRRPLEARGEEAAKFLFPLMNGERCFGALRVVVPMAGLEDGNAVEQVGSGLALLAAQVARALCAPEAYERAVLDKATGVYSRRHFLSRLAEATSFCRRYGEPLSLIVLDIDSFGMLNSTFGAAAGDRLLHWAASLVKQNVREADSVYRCGADELAVLLPNTEADKALAVAERLRRVARESRAMADDGSPIIATLSAGVAEFDEDMRGAEPLLARAQEALRSATAHGRDRVAMWRPPEPEEPAPEHAPA